MTIRELLKEILESDLPLESEIRIYGDNLEYEVKTNDVYVEACNDELVIAFDRADIRIVEE